MRNKARKRLGVLAGIAITLCILAILALFSRSPKHLPSKTASSEIDSFEPSPRVTFVVKDAVEQPAEESVEATPSSGKGQSPEADVYGVIRDEKGKPVNGAEVHAFQFDSGAKRYDATTTTRDDGTYSLKGLHINNPYPYRIIASMPGYASTSSEVFALDGTPREVDITLSKGASLSGRVSTSAGEGIEGATLSLVDSSWAGAHWAYLYTDYDTVLSATTGAGGDYSFPNTPPGKYWLYARANNHYDENKLIAISPKDSEITRNIVLDFATEEYISGVVIDEKSGKPVEGARIRGGEHFFSDNRERVINRVSYTDAEGRFHLKGFQGRSRVTVFKRGYNRKDAGGRDNNDLTIQLSSRYDWSELRNDMSGRVFDNESSQPIATFSVAVFGDNAEIILMGRKSFCVYSQTFNSPDGGFTIPDVRAERVRLMVSAPGYATRIVESLVYPKVVPEKILQSMRERGREDDLKNFSEIGLERGATVTGVVRGPGASDPVPGARVYLDYDWQDHIVEPISLSVYADDLGRYKLEGVPEGPQCVVASHPDYVPAYSGEIQFEKGKVYSEMNFSLDSGGSVEGVISGSGRQQEGVEINFQPIDSPILLQKLGGHSVESRFFGPSHVAQVDDKGRYRVDGLPPGYSHVRAYIRSGENGRPAPLNEVIEIREGETTVFDIQPCDGRIEGTIYFSKSLLPDPKKFRSNLAAGKGYYAILRKADAPPIDLSGESRPVIEFPIRQDRNRISREHWSFDFRGICPGEYTVTVLPYGNTPDRRGAILAQKSVAVKVRAGRETEVTVRMR